MSSSSRKNIPVNSSSANGFASLSTQQPRPVCKWSAHAPQSGPSPWPFPRNGHTLTATATSTPFSELFLFGGHSGGRVRSDLYVFSTQDFSTIRLQTSGKVPIPRAAHGAAVIGTTLLICGGKTDSGYQSVLNHDSIYLLNLVLREWTHVVVNGPGPGCRFNHSITVVGSKLFVFGGRIQIGGKATNDMWTLDLNCLKTKPLWELYEPTPENQKPLSRCSHVLVTTEDHIIIFGGFGDQHYYNDTWSFDISTRKWTELRCTGSIPSPRSGHAGVLVDDIMYVFDGFSTKEGHMDDLYALRLSTRRWFKIHNEGTIPHRRAYHAMTSNGTRVFVLGGYSKDAPADEISLIHVFDTDDIKYPEDDVGEGSTKYHVNFAAPHSSTEGEVTRLEVEQQPSVSLGVQTDRDQRVTWLTDELALNCARLEQAEANVAEGKRRAILELREHESRLLAQTSLVNQREAELVNTQSKLRNTEAQLDESLLSFGQQIGRYRAELANVRAELDAKKSELEAVRLRLADADGDWAKSKTKADKLRTVRVASLIDLNEDRDMYNVKEDKQVMEAELASPQWNEKSIEG